jgi:hypothetical protein
MMVWVSWICIVLTFIFALVGYFTPFKFFSPFGVLFGFLSIFLTLKQLKDD